MNVFFIVYLYFNTTTPDVNPPQLTPPEVFLLDSLWLTDYVKNREKPDETEYIIRMPQTASGPTNSRETLYEENFDDYKDDVDPNSSQQTLHEDAGGDNQELIAVFKQVSDIMAIQEDVFRCRVTSLPVAMLE